MTIPVTGGPSPSASKFSQHFSHENKRQTGARKPEPLPCAVLAGPGADVLFIRTFVTLIIAFLNTDRVNPCGPEPVRKY